jgi:Tol biopolymer transport system component
MKKRLPRKFLRRLVAIAIGFAACVAMRSSAAFVYETPAEFLTSGDFNGDGIPDVLVLDKLTGNARVGYSDGQGNLTWSAPLVTGVANATGCGVEHFLNTNRDSVAVTAPTLNLVNLVDLSQTNSAGTLQTFTPEGIGSHAVAGLHAPRTPLSPGTPFLFVASSFNDGSAEELELGQLPRINYGTNPEVGQFDLANGLDISSNFPTLGVGVVRGVTNDALHLWEFDTTPGVVGVFSNLPPGSDYVFGNFNGEALPRFIFYQPGGSNLAIAPLLHANSSYAFGAALSVALNRAVQNVFFLSNNTNGSALIQFGDGIEGLTLPNGSPVVTSNYQSGAGAAGNAFTGVVPLKNGLFALLDAPPGTASAHAQVLRFDGTTFTPLSTTNLPPLTTAALRANVWLFQLEPFVNRSPGFIVSLSSPDWADSVTVLPSAVQVQAETDSGTNSGLIVTTTNNLGAPPVGVAFGIGNQYNPAISLFGYNPAQVATPVAVTISPPPGPYGSPQSISFTAVPSAATINYRANSQASWQGYVAPFVITNDCTVGFYAVDIDGKRSALQLATYTFGAPVTGGTNSPIATNPGNTNTVPVLNTNQLTISQDGTVIYGRRSAANVGTIWAINLDGSSDTYITTGVRPRVSPDGRLMAFLRDGNPFNSQGNIWLRDLSSGQERRLFNNPDSVVCYDWYPDDSALLTDYSCDIWRLGTNGVISQVIATDCYDDAPVLNPADGRIAFHNLNPTNSIAGLYVAAPNGSGRQRIVSSPAGASWPSWAPDGGVLAFVDGNNSSTVDDGTNLWLVNPDGTDLLQLTGFSDGTNRFPHGAIWTSDGSALVGAGTIFGTNGLWLVPLTPELTDCDGPPILLPTSPGDSIDFAGSVVTAAPSQFVANQGPGLFIRLAPNAVVVYWSANFAGYTLESESSLPAHAWASVPGPFFFANGYYVYWETRDALAPEKLFRLHLTGAMILSLPPTLTIQVQANTALISWPTNISGFVLQSRTDLSPSSSWNDLLVPYTVNGLNFQYPDPINSFQRKFYRLRGP